MSHEIPLIQSNPCNINECAGELCPKSSTSICCKNCGTPQHIEQIRDNFKEMAEDPDLAHPAMQEEMEAIIHHLIINHKCRTVTLPCKGKREFILSLPSS